MEEIETEYDVIVLGTGFVESLVAAACARVGVKVLHVDSNEFYGGQWASFSFSALQEWSNVIGEIKDECDDISSHDLNKWNFISPQSVFYNVKQDFDQSSFAVTKEESSCQDTEGGLQSDSELHLEDSIEKVKSKPNDLERCISHNTLIAESRRFNIDLAPKVVYSRGKLVELLISSNVARYLEFKCLNRILSLTSDDDLIEVPCSRSDVFKTDSVSLIEKRLLMKFMEFCHHYEEKENEWKDYSTSPFCEFLSMHHLSSKVEHFVRTSIAMVGAEASTEDGLKRMSLFIRSLGRFGPMPFLYPLYGSGEIPQAFCRLCAVFEGIYMLRTKIDYVIRCPTHVEGIVSEGKKYTCKHLVINSGYIPVKDRSNNEHSLSRGIFITDKSIYPIRDDHVTMLHMINSETNETVKVLQLCSGTGVCPKNTNIVHMTCKGVDAESDLKNIVQKLFERDDGGDKISLLYSLYFNQAVNITLKKEDSLSNVYCCGGPDETMDYDRAIEQASEIFSSMYPGSEFLPRAPDPDEIIFEAPEQNDDERLESEIDGDCETNKNESVEFVKEENE